MAIQLTNYDPAIQQGATVNVSGSMSQITDTNGNESLTIAATTSAVNYLNLINSATTVAVQLNAAGDDTNVGFSLSTKGTGGFTLTAATLTGTQLDLVSAALTSGKGIDMSDLDAITTGKGIHISATGITQTSGILAHIASASTAITGAGRLFLVDHTGNAGVSATLAEITSAAADETIVASINASAGLTGTVLSVGGASVATGTVLRLTNNSALTTGIIVSIQSTATAITGAGRLLYSNHSAATSTSGIINEFRTTSGDETVLLQATATGALALGKILNISGAAVTTGTLLSVADADALTTGMIAQFKSNSADATARTLVDIHNDNSAAVGVTPLVITQDAVTSTNFKLMMTLGTIKIFISDQTTPNAVLSAAEGSICLNGSATGQAFWNNDGATSWAALA